MRNQIKFTFQIGYAAPNAAFERGIANEASRLCGGCTTAHKTGWWREDGASHTATFGGTLEQEHCFELELTCEERKAEHVFELMRAAIATLAYAHDVATNWVHVSEAVMTGRHFSVAAINADIDAKVTA